MRVRVEFGETRGYVTHRNVQRAREGRDRDLLRLTHVENFEPLAAVEPPLELQWFDFLYRRHRNNRIYRGLTPKSLLCQLLAVALSSDNPSWLRGRVVSIYARPFTL